MPTSAATTSRSDRRAPPRGFSLVELTLVLVILAILAGAVALRTEAAWARVRMDELAARVVEFDRLTRLDALAKDRRLQIVVDLSAGEMTRADDRGDRLEGGRLAVPAGCTIARLLIRDEDIWGGAAAVGFSRRGLSPSYALLLQRADGRRRWLVFAGLTGQVIHADDETDVRSILEAASKRPDAG